MEILLSEVVRKITQVVGQTPKVWFAGALNQAPDSINQYAWESFFRTLLSKALFPP